MHEPPSLAITLHDVAPATLPACRQLAALVESLDPRAPLTLLIVPDFHGRGRADQAPEFRAWVDARLARGDEVALHGFRHVDTAPRPTRPGGWVRRQLLGGGEAEFAALASGPARRSNSAMISTSRMCGTFVRCVRPVASKLAAMSLSTEFFAPGARTVPARRAPPVTSKASISGRA
jgi:predicted deacetylase